MAQYGTGPAAHLPPGRSSAQSSSEPWRTMLSVGTNIASGSTCDTMTAAAASNTMLNSTLPTPIALLLLLLLPTVALQQDGRVAAHVAQCGPAVVSQVLPPHPRLS